MFEFIDKNGNISANSAKLVVIDKYGKVKEVGGGGGSPTGPAGGDLSGTYPNPSVVWNNGLSTYNLLYYPLSSNPAGYLTSAVTSVTATSPITSSGGNTPIISTSMATNKLIGRSSAGTGVMEEIIIGTGLSLTGGTLNVTVSGGILHGTASGTDTYTVTITGVTSYADGDAYLIRFPNGNTTSATLNINGLGAIPLYRNNDGAVLGGDIIDGAEMLCVYNSTSLHFQVIGVAPNTLIAYVTNDDSVTITKGQAVYAFGGTGDRMTVKLANNSSDATSAQTVGLVLSTSIAANQKGLIMMQGLLDGLSILPTSTWNDGDPVYLGATPGSITKVKPVAPNHLVYLGVVTTASPGASGRMYVRVQNGYELNELHDVLISSPQNNDVLMYNSTTTLWDNEDPFDYFDARSVAYQKHINIPIIGNAGVNNVEGVGFVVGGGTARAWTSTNLVTKTQRIGLVTATTGNPAQIRQINNYLTREDGFSAISGFNMAENATDSTVRFFIGFSTLAIFSNVEANTLINCAGFCKLTTSNNVNVVHNDNTGTATTIDLGVNFPANTISTDKYFLYWETVPTGIYVKIVRVGTIYSYETILTTDIPTTTTALNFGAYVVDSTGASVSTGADWYGTYIRVLS